MLVNLNDVLRDAQKKHYAVGLFNTTDTDMLEAAIAAAEEARSPIIIGTAEVLLPFGELKLIAPSIIAAAKRASVPVVVHYDHGLTEERCMEAIELGFSSIMFDGSLGAPSENLERTAKMVKYAHSRHISVEGEIGHVGEASTGDNETNDMYTTPGEAIDFVRTTGVDALAIAFGTSHGFYNAQPKLDFDVVKNVAAATGLPLVMHGGSGVSEEGFKAAIAGGIRKINYYSYMSKAGYEAAKKEIEAGNSSYLHDVEFAAMKAMKEDVKEAIRVFANLK